MKGRVVKWIDGRGFGFVRADDGARDFFVHASAVVGDAPYKTLVEGEPVAFELKPAEKDGRAIAAYVVRLNAKGAHMTDNAAGSNPAAAAAKSSGGPAALLHERMATDLVPPCQKPDGKEHGRRARARRRA